MILGAHGAPGSRALGHLLTRLRDPHPGILRVAWRHIPADGGAALALVAEAAAIQSHFSA
jgi:hypothetical protein